MLAQFNVMAPKGEPKPEIDLETRARIVELRAAGKGFEDIAKEVGVSTNGAYYVWRRWKIYRHIEDLPRTGAPHKISPKNIQKMKTLLKRHRLKSTREGAEWLSQEGEPKPVTVVHETVRQAFKHAGYRAFKQVSATQLTHKQQAERLRLVKIWRETERDWSNVIFSDETTIRDAPRGRTLWQWLPAGTPPEHRKTKRKAPFGGKSIRLWAAITRDGILAWKIIDGHLNSDGYKKLLEEKLIPNARKKFGKTRFVFQQDNAGEHVSRVTMDWLREKSKSTTRYPGFEILEWPALSPDLNPIENLWSEVLDSFSQDGAPKLSKAQFIEHVRAHFTALERPEDPSYFHHLYDSMPRRLQKVLEAKGSRIGY